MGLSFQRAGVTNPAGIEPASQGLIIQRAGVTNPAGIEPASQGLIIQRETEAQEDILYPMGPAPFFFFSLLNHSHRTVHPTRTDGSSKPLEG
ncbi:MAG TPA: hypothetical protein VK450_04570 [Methanomicrobiales archaeon]|nr:hypothetical protein [Methanomicrobiales archaeon]